MNQKPTEVNQNYLRLIADFIATGAYSGRVRKAPGTAGTAFALLLTLPLVLTETKPTLFLQVFVVAAVFVIGLWSSNVVLAALAANSGSSTDSGNKDPGFIVIDEVCGYFVALLGSGWSGKEVLLAFVFFRFFDILKPPPVSWAEKLHGGLGIMADDVLAGVYASLLLSIFSIVFF